MFQLLADSNIEIFDNTLAVVRDSTSVETQDEDELKTLCFEIHIDLGNTPKETIQEVLKALSDLYCAAGGLGLEFSVEDGFIRAEKKVSL